MSNDKINKPFPFQPDQSDAVVFCVSARDGKIDNVKISLQVFGPSIVNEKDRMDMTALAWAAWAGHLDIMQLLLENGADINIGGYDKNCSPLAWAAYKGKTEAVRLLLENGADVDKKNDDGETAEMIARRYGQHDIAALIAEWRTVKRTPTAAATDVFAKKTTDTRLEKLKAQRPPTSCLKKRPTPEI